MARLALRAIIGSLVLSFCVVFAGCTPGGGSGTTNQPAPASASPADRDGY